MCSRIYNNENGLIQEFDTYIKIQFCNSKKNLKFYYIWLRDHCRCSQCYNLKTHQISFNIQDIPLDIKLASCSIVKNNVQITWYDGHESNYSLKWLEDIDFPLCSKKDIILWDKNDVSKFKDTVVPIKKFLEDSDGPKQLLTSLLKYGFGFVTGVNPTLEATESVVKRIAPVQKTLFGEMWSVSNDYYHNDTAYTNIALSAHTDNTYFTEAAGLQIFHMLSHEGTGGETLLVDGFNVAENLKNRNTNAFTTLCNHPLQSQYIEEGHHFSTIEPVIKLHPVTKEFLQIRYNVYDRGVLNSISQDEILQFYSAYQLLGKEIADPKNEFWLKLTPGSVLFIDNWRVLHGRAAYTGKRDLCGCYVTRAEWLSKAETFDLNII